jgi:hypothetical protein
MWKEAVIFLYEVHRGTEEKRKQPLSGQPVAGPKLRSRSVAYRTVRFDSYKVLFHTAAHIRNRNFRSFDTLGLLVSSVRAVEAISRLGFE